MAQQELDGGDTVNERRPIIYQAMRNRRISIVFIALRASISGFAGR